MVFKYFVLISNNNTMNPTFSPVRNASTYVSSNDILGHVNIKHSKFCNEKDFWWVSANHIYQNCEHQLQIYRTICMF